MLRSAAAAIARVCVSSGRSTSGAGRGSKPTKTSGSPEALSRPLARDLGDRREDLGQCLDRGGVLRDLGQTRDRADGHEAAHQPDDQDRLGHPDDRPAHPVRGAQDARAERHGHPPAEGRTDRLADGDGEQQPGHHDERAQRRLHVAQPVGEPGEGQDRHRAADEGAYEAADLRQGPGPESEDDRDDDQGDGDQVKEVHATIARGRLRPRPPANRCGPGGAPPRRRSRAPSGGGSRVRPCRRGSSPLRTGRCRSPACCRPGAGRPAPRGRR